MNPNWHEIWLYSDAALRRMARSERDMRAPAAKKELERRANEAAAKRD